MADNLNVRIQGDDQSQQATDSARKNIGRLEKASASLREKWRDLTIIGAGVKRVLDGITSTVTGLLGATEQQVNSEIRLAVALARTGKATRDQLDSMKQWAAQRQEATTFGDELSLSLAALGAQFGLTGSLLAQTVEAAQDVSVALGKQPSEIVQKLGRAYAGLGLDLAELGVQFDRGLPRVEAYEKALGQLRTGLSEAVTETPFGRLQQLNNLWGDLKERIGEVVVSTGLFNTIIKSLTGGVGNFGSFLKDNLGAIVSIIDGVAAGVVRVIGFILRAFETLIHSTTSLAAVFDNELAASIDGAKNALRAAGEKAELMSARFGENSEQAKQAAKALKDAQAQYEEFAGIVDLGSETLFRFADSIQNSAQPLEQASSSLFDRIFAAFRDQPRIDEETQALVEAITLSLEEHGEAAGQGFYGSFQVAAVQAFNEDVGMQEAWRNLGGNLRDVFVAEMSGAALDPIKSGFKELASAAALPFRLIGQVVAAPINAIASLISGAIQKLVGELLVVLGFQKLAAALGLTASASAIAQAEAIGVAWAAPAAAAAIASFGAALGFGPAAVGVIGSSAAAIKGLMAVPALAEGALVLPQPGGVTVTVAEAGQPELIVPLDKAERMGVGRRSPSIHIGTLVVSSGDRRDAERFLDIVYEEMERRERELGTRRRLG